MGESNELKHYGIPKQKWGERRFQNLDRTWTEEGKIRYGKGNKAAKRREEGYEKKGIGYQNPLKLENVLELTKRQNLNKIEDGEFGDKKKAKELAKKLEEGNEDAKYIQLIKLAYHIVRNPFMLPFDAYRIAKAAESKKIAKKYEEERNKNPIDKKTGFHKKQEETTIEEDMKRVNPERWDWNSNTKMNCMMCTTTLEMRRRGYDVTSNKTGFGRYTEDTLKWFPKAKVDNYHLNPDDKREYKREEAIKADFHMNGKYAKDVISKIEAKYPEGSRGNLTLKWGAGGGHSVFFEIKDGKMIIRDAQVNKTYTNPEKILRACYDIDVTRLDNVDFDAKSIKECCR